MPSGMYVPFHRMDLSANSWNPFLFAIFPADEKQVKQHNIPLDIEPFSFLNREGLS
jgi:hypothetical protein